MMNISESGMGICVARPVSHDVVSNLRFKLPPSREAIAVQGQIAWKTESRKTLGIHFLDPPEAVQRQIRRWAQSGSMRPWLPEGGPKRADRVSPAVSSPPTLLASLSASQPSLPRDPGGSHHRFPNASAQGQRAVGELEPPGNPPPVSRGIPRPALSLGLETWRDPRPAPPTHVDERPPRTANVRLAVLFCLLIALSLVLGFTSDSALLVRSRALWQAMVSEWVLNGTPPVNHAPRVSSPPSRPPQTSPERAVGDQPLLPSDKPSSVAEPRTPSGPAASPLAAREPAARPAESSLRRSRVGAAPTRSGQAMSGRVSVLSHLHTIRVPPDLRSSNILRRNGLRLGEPLFEHPPTYPRDALQDGVEGTVKVRAVIGRDGSVASAKVEDGPALLAEPSLAAIRGWRYQPTRLGSRAVEWEEDIILVFRLQNSSAPQR